MIEKLSKILLPNDLLLKEYVQTYPVLQQQHPKKTCGWVGSVTKDWVMDTRVQEIAKRFIARLFEKRECVGYSYHLNAQEMLKPLAVQFKWEPFVAAEDKNQILAHIQDMADEFACSDTLIHDITKVELLYFYIRVANPSLSWLAVEYMLQCFPWHAHLFMSRHRKYSWTEERPSCPKASCQK